MKRESISAFLAEECGVWQDDRTWREWFKQKLTEAINGGYLYLGQQPKESNDDWRWDYAATLAKYAPSIVTLWEGSEIGEVDWALTSELTKQIVDFLCDERIKRDFPPLKPESIDVPGGDEVELENVLRPMV